MSFRIIDNSSPFESQTLKTFLKSITGGTGGLIDGFDLDQEDQINLSTDILNISPGTIIFNGEIVKISSTIKIQNIYQKSQDGDVLFIKNMNDDPTYTNLQIGWGRVSQTTNTIHIAYRKNGLWHRKMNVIINNRLLGKDYFHIEEDTIKNTLIIDLYPDAAFFDGASLFDGTTSFDGEI